MRATTEILLVPAAGRADRACAALADRAPVWPAPPAAALAAAAAELMSLELSPPPRVANFLAALPGGACFREDAGRTELARAASPRPGVGGADGRIWDVNLVQRSSHKRE